MFWIRAPAILVCILTSDAYPLIAQSPPAPSTARPGDGTKALVENYARTMVTVPPESLGLDPFYKKYADAFGIPIVCSEKVDDVALLMARDIVNYMVSKRPDLRAVM